MNSLITRIVVRYLLGETFRPAKRNAFGDMILKKTKFVFICCILGLLLTSLGLSLMLLDESAEELIPFAWLVGVGVVLFLFHVLNHLVFRAEAGEASVSVRSLRGSRTLNYGELSSVGYSRLNSGQFLLQSAAGTVRIPAGIRGAAELIALISGKIGGAACTEAQKVLDDKRIELARWSR